MTPIAAPIDCANRYKISLDIAIFYFFKKKNPKVTDGLKWPPVNGAQITIAKYSERLTKIS